MFDSRIINEPSSEYAYDVYVALGDIFEQMIDTPYDKDTLAASLSSVLTDGFTIEPMGSNQLLLSILYKEVSVLDYDITIKDGIFYDCRLHKEKEDIDKIIDAIYENIK